MLGAATVLALFAWTTPNHYPPWLTFHGELSMAVALLLVTSWMCWRDPGSFRSPPPLAIAAFATMFIPAAQFALGEVKFIGDVWMTSLYLGGFGLAIWLGRAAVQQFGVERVLEPMEWIILAGAVVSTWLALYQWQGLEYLEFFVIEIPAQSRPYANLIQPNNLATLLVLGMLATAYLFEAGRLHRATSTLLIAVLGFGVAMTQSRTGLVEIAVAGTLIIASTRRGNAMKIRARHVAGALAIAFVMPLVWAAVRTTSSNPSGHDLAEMAQAGLRPLHWAAMVDAIERKPWAGFGWNQLGAADYLVAIDHPATHETLAQSHNLLLDLLVWNGIPLGTLLVVVLAAWFATVLPRCNTIPKMLAFSGVLVVFLHAMLEYPLYYTYFLLPVGVWMGVLSQDCPKMHWRVPTALFPALLTVAGAALVATAIDYFGLEEDVRRMRFHQAHIAASAELPDSTAPLGPSQTRILTQFTHFWNFALKRERKAMTAGELNEMEVVTLRFPSKENMLRYAAALALNHQPESASQVLRRICKINTAQACELSRKIWAWRAQEDQEIAAVPWPLD